MNAIRRMQHAIKCSFLWTTLYVCAGAIQQIKCTTYCGSTIAILHQIDAEHHDLNIQRSSRLDSGRALCHKRHARRVGSGALFVSEENVWEARNTQLSLGHHLAAVDVCALFGPKFAARHK